MIGTSVMKELNQKLLIQVSGTNLHDCAKCHCVKSARIRSYCGPHFPAFGLNTGKYSASPYSVRMEENRDKNNSEYGHFSRSVSFSIQSNNFEINSPLQFCTALQWLN